MTIPTVFRSRTDLLAPFAATGRFARLEVAQLDIFAGPDPIWDAFEASGGQVRRGQFSGAGRA
jgi:hypothetical protein